MRPKDKTLTAQALTEIPEKFGLAKTELHFQATPTRIDDVIRFPKTNTNMRVYSLLDGTQFLALIGAGLQPVTYFGGTDETPFLVRLDSTYGSTFLRSGEEGFYAGLVPSRIRQLERLFGPSTVTRQGDLWAYDLGMSWEALARHHCQVSNMHFATNTNRMTLFATRHTLSGGRAVSHRVVLAAGEKPLRLNKSSVGDGTLTAPDHESVTLRGPHAFARTPGILPATATWHDNSSRQGGVGD